MTKKLPTIRLQGKDYVQVKDRILCFNELYPKGSITTSVEHNNGYAYFTAAVMPDIDMPTRQFIAHSAGQIKEQKSFEKLETVAVGRALAFMGIGVLEGIASADEMQDFYKTKKTSEIVHAQAPKATHIDPANLPPCNICGAYYKFIPAGTTKTNKKYEAFYACSTRDCKAKSFPAAMAHQRLNAMKQSTLTDNAPPPPSPYDY